MTEVEAASVPAPVADAVTKASPGPRLKKPTKPDDAAVKAQIAKLEEQIAQYNKRVQEIRTIIDAKRSNVNEYVSSEERGIRSKLAQLRAEWESTLKQKQQTKAELEEVSKTRESIRTHLRSMKTKIQYPTLDKIDDQIVKLEQKMQHTSLSLQEEKKVLEQIKTLKSSRATVQEYNEKLEKLNQDEAVKNELYDRLKGFDEKLNSIKAERTKHQSTLDELKEKEQAETADIPTLQEERTECREIVNKAWEKKRELWAEFKAKLEEFREQDKLWKQQRNEDYARKKAEYEKQKAERDAARKARAAELAGEPFEREISSCDDLTFFLSKFIAKEAAVKEVVEDKAIETPEGFKVMKKKDDDMDPWFNGTGGKKAKKGKKAKQEDKPVDEKLNFTIDMINAFGLLKVSVPLVKSEVQESLDELKLRKEYYLEKRQKAKDGIVDPPEEEPEEDVAEAEEEGVVMWSNGLHAEPVEVELEVDSASDEVAVKLTISEEA